MDGLTIAFIPAFCAVGLILGWYTLGLFSQIGQRILRVWCPLNRRRHRRRVERRVLALSTKAPQVGRRLPPTNGSQPPTPAWLRKAAGE